MNGLDQLSMRYRQLGVLLEPLWINQEARFRRSLHTKGRETIEECNHACSRPTLHSRSNTMFVLVLSWVGTRAVLFALIRVYAYYLA